MQCHRARKVSAANDCCDTRKNSVMCLGQKLCSSSTFASDPVLICCGKVDRYILKGTTPICPSRVKMGMRYDDGGKPAEVVDVLDGILINVAYQIPKNIAVSCTNEKTTIRYTYIWRFDFDGCDILVDIILLKFEAMTLVTELRKGGESLTSWRHILSRIITNEA